MVGLFSKFFKKQEKTASLISENSDDFYFVNVDQIISSIYLNLSLAEKSKPDSDQMLF